MSTSAAPSTRASARTGSRRTALAGSRSATTAPTASSSPTPSSLFGRSDLPFPPVEREKRHGPGEDDRREHVHPPRRAERLHVRAVDLREHDHREVVGGV